MASWAEDSSTSSSSHSPGLLVHENPSDARDHHNMGSPKRRSQSGKRPHPRTAKCAHSRRSGQEQ
jgi:hypothetical protein